MLQSVTNQTKINTSSAFVGAVEFGAVGLIM